MPVKKELTLVQKLSKISDEIGKLVKDGENKFQKYTYLSVDGVYEAVRPLLAKYEVFVSSKIIECNTEHVPKIDGKIQFYATVWIEYTFHSGDETLSTHNYGSAMDSSDKASTQAMRACHKYAYIQAFNISSGDKDPDSKNPEAAKLPPTIQLKKLTYPTIPEESFSLEAIGNKGWDGKIERGFIKLKDKKGKVVYYEVSPDQAKAIKEHIQNLELQALDIKESKS